MVDWVAADALVFGRAENGERWRAPFDALALSRGALGGGGGATAAAATDGDVGGEADAAAG